MKFLKLFWRNFSQAVTILLALIFVLRFYIPGFPAQLFAHAPAVVETQQAPSVAPPTNTTMAEQSFSASASTAMPSVVNIFTTQKPKNRRRSPFLDDPFFRFFFGERLQKFEQNQKPKSSLGSGVIIDQSGLIATNHHVVAEADNIEVALTDGRKLSATIVGSDPETDLALLQVDAKALPTITFANISNLAVGDVVLAIGNPFGVGQTVTQGIVSALGRNHLGINTFENFIQTDASINPGNSGGALVNTAGQLVGINSAIYSKSGGSMGIGFAIPASLAKQVLDQIINHGKVTRGWIGVGSQDITPALAESFGLDSTDGTIITGILRQGPADQAGLQLGDIILAVDKQKATNSDSMMQLVAALTPQQKATLTLLRDGEMIEVAIVIGTRPSKVRR